MFRWTNFRFGVYNGRALSGPRTDGGRSLKGANAQPATRQIVFATWVGIIANVLLTLAKAVVGFLSHSQALIADAAHSASDVAGSVVALFAVQVAKSPPDEDHPYGHGKAEHVASIIVGLLLILVGGQIAISSIRISLGGPPPAPGVGALPIIIVSIVLKEILFHYKMRLGRRYNSAVLKAEAWHHRSDAFSSLAALAGVGAALVGEQTGLAWLLYGDAAAGILVSAVIVRIGIQLARQSSSIVMEQVLDAAEVQKYADTVLDVDGVVAIDQLHARPHGRYVVIDIKISVDAYITVEAGHRIAKRVKEMLCDVHPEVEDVLVHVNPYG